MSQILSDLSSDTVMSSPGRWRVTASPVQALSWALTLKTGPLPTLAASKHTTSLVHSCQYPMAIQALNGSLPFLG